MLQLRPNCDYCDKDLAPHATDARICSYECTFCAHCAEFGLWALSELRRRVRAATDTADRRAPSWCVPRQATGLDETGASQMGSERTAGFVQAVRGIRPEER